MELKMLEKLRNIVRDANQIRGLKALYEAKTANPHCDKYGPVFGVSFECLTGYDGDSGRSIPFSVADADAVRNAFQLALNEHKWLILETMADYLMEEANSLRSYAESEIADAHILLDLVRKEAEAPCTTE
jgi:hypothetical protein